MCSGYALNLYGFIWYSSSIQWALKFLLKENDWDLSCSAIDSWQSSHIVACCWPIIPTSVVPHCCFPEDHTESYMLVPPSWFTRPPGFIIGPCIPWAKLTRYELGVLEFRSLHLEHQNIAENSGGGWCWTLRRRDEPWPKVNLALIEMWDCYD